jgi:hypothetical protein
MDYELENLARFSLTTWASESLKFVVHSSQPQV